MEKLFAALGASIVASLSWVSLFSVRGDELPPVRCMITPVEQHTNEFSGREFTRSFRIDGEMRTKVRLSWRLHAAQRTLARGEQNLEIVNLPSTVKLKFRVDALREDAVLPVDLSVAVYAGENTQIQHKSKLWFFPETPFDTRAEWLRKLDIHIFDPSASTETLFREAAIPFTSVTNPTRLRSLQMRTLVIGAGTSLNTQRNLAESVTAAAMRGTDVLWLSAQDGQIPWKSLQSASALEFANASIIYRLDRRLDPSSWEQAGFVSSKVSLIADDRKVALAFSDEGWPWLEARWTETNGRLIYTGFPIVSGWNDCPTSRYLLLSLFERLNAEE